MFSNKRTLYRQESTCTYVKAYGLSSHSLCPDCLKYIFRKMQTRRRSRHRAPETCIKGLISLQIHFFCISVQIRRYRNGSAYFKHLRERSPVIPLKLDHRCFSDSLDKIRSQVHFSNLIVLQWIIQRKSIILPSFHISYDTFPSA